MNTQDQLLTPGKLWAVRNVTITYSTTLMQTRQQGTWEYCLMIHWALPLMVVHVCALHDPVFNQSKESQCHTSPDFTPLATSYCQNQILRLWCWTATGNTFSNINIRICTININKTKITIWLTGLWVWVAYNLHLKKQHTLNILPNLQWEMFIKSVVQQNTTFDNMFYSSV